MKRDIFTDNVAYTTTNNKHDIRFIKMSDIGTALLITDVEIHIINNYLVLNIGKRTGAQGL